MTGDAAARLEYLAEAGGLLWPGTAGRDRIVLPDPRAPRLLVPRRPARAGAAALVRYTATQGARERAVGFAVAGAVRVGLGRGRPDALTAAETDSADETVDQLLAGVLGEPVSTALPLTPRRANRKPVLQVFDRRGRTLAFAKIGVSPLARELVDAEAATLRRLAAGGLGDGGPGTDGLGGAALDIPRVLHHGAWRDTAVLVTTALPLGRRAAVDSPLVQAAMRAVAAAGGSTGSAADGGAEYLAGLRTRAGALPAGQDAWLELLDELTTAADGPAGVADLATGAWHGDWTAWNCARHGVRRGGRLAVWDWERFAAPVPRGFDPLHFRLNDAVGKQRTRFAPAATDLVHDARDLLDPWGLTGAQARLVAGLYLFDIALRYAADGNSPARGDDPVLRWAAPAVRAAARPDRRPEPSR